ncbi:hypothetical protein [Actinoalloteichus hymeniacidonis]|uniref:Uncharacterized protein n=1 Tax=Actinoalloteichus hymeniacidonis TaxID=340345 RepID=A0AAC9HV87_9PSEU|nr:hypothetical protein [Actinoalloteichus hymeniacidonis]AOS65786.1 hypothetical protein TL08_25040 [Actinoalloteichus hymeniacidonis]MBB5906123.1 hypothetical protein [Actinoalloteichus hymeniacidonis]
MVEDRFELLVTVVVGAENERRARAACQGLLSLAGGRIVEAGDCSAEEPGCWSVTIRRSAEVTASEDEAATLGRAVRRFLRRLGPKFANSRVACEPPTAWSVIDDPELLGTVIPSGERLLIEAWSDDSALPLDTTPVAGPASAESGPGAGESGVVADEADDDMTGLPRLQLRVEVRTDRAAGAHWQARAVASRLVQQAAILRTDQVDQRTFGVTMDLGHRPGTLAEAAREAAAILGAPGWSPVDETAGIASTNWSTSAPGRNGVVGLHLSARYIEDSESHAITGDLAASTSNTLSPEAIRPTGPSAAELLSVEHRASLPRDEQRWSWWSQ